MPSRKDYLDIHLTQPEIKNLQQSQKLAIMMKSHNIIDKKQGRTPVKYEDFTTNSHISFQRAINNMSQTAEILSKPVSRARKLHSLSVDQFQLSEQQMFATEDNFQNNVIGQNQKGNLIAQLKKLQDKKKQILRNKVNNSTVGIENKPLAEDQRDRAYTQIRGQINQENSSDAYVFDQEVSQDLKDEFSKDFQKDFFSGPISEQSQKKLIKIEIQQNSVFMKKSEIQSQSNSMMSPSNWIQYDQLEQLKLPRFKDKIQLSLKELKLLQQRKNYSLFKKSIAKQPELSPLAKFLSDLDDETTQRKETFLPEQDPNFIYHLANMPGPYKNLRINDQRLILWQEQNKRNFEFKQNYKQELHKVLIKKKTELLTGDYFSNQEKNEILPPLSIKKSVSKKQDSDRLEDQSFERILKGEYRDISKSKMQIQKEDATNFSQQEKLSVFSMQSQFRSSKESITPNEDQPLIVNSIYLQSRRTKFMNFIKDIDVGLSNFIKGQQKSYQVWHFHQRKLLKKQLKQETLISQTLKQKGKLDTDSSPRAKTNLSFSSSFIAKMPKHESELKIGTLSDFALEAVHEKKQIKFDFGEKDEKIKQILHDHEYTDQLAIIDLFGMICRDLAEKKLSEKVWHARKGDYNISQFDQELLKQQMKKQLLNEFAKQISQDRQVQEIVVNIASIDLHDIELLEYSLFPNDGEKGEQKNQELVQYIQELSGGIPKNKLIMALSYYLKKFIAQDIITKFNLKMQGMSDQLINQVIARVDHKDQLVSQKLGDQNQEHNQFLLSYLKNNQTPLPLTLKVFDKRLVLNNYYLGKQIQDDGWASSMQFAFKDNPKLVSYLFFSNCGLNDRACASILEGSLYLQTLNSFVFQNEQFGSESVKVLAEILKRGFPGHLSEIKLIRCKIKSFELEQLLKQITKNNFIKTFVLIKSPLTKTAIQLLGQFIDNSKYLKELEISFCEVVTSKLYIPMLESLSRKNGIEILNLGQNTLYDCNYHKEEYEQIRYEKQITELLSTLLFNNKTLVHLQLNSCGLSKNILAVLLPYIKFSRCLVSCHLSENIGFDEQSTQIFGDYLNLQTSKETDFENIQFEFRKRKQGFLEETTGTTNELKMIKMQSRKIQTEKECLFNYHQYDSLKPFILSRVLGFDEHLQINPSKTQLKQYQTAQIQAQKFRNRRESKRDLVYENQTPLKQSEIESEISKNQLVQIAPSEWRLQNKCWVCNHDIYSLLFWNKKIGQRIAIYDDIVNKKLILNIIKKLPYFTNRPVIYSKQNGWEAQELMTLAEFCWVIDKDKPTEFKDISFSELKEYEEAVFGGLTHAEKRRRDLDYNVLAYLKSYQTPIVFRSIIDKNLVFREPNFINSSYSLLASMNNFYDIEDQSSIESSGSDNKRRQKSQLQKEKEKQKAEEKQKNTIQMTTFILPQFLPCGKFSYIIEFPENTFYFHQAMINFRTESLPVQFRKETNKNAGNIRSGVKSQTSQNSRGSSRAGSNIPLITFDQHNEIQLDHTLFKDLSQNKTDSILQEQMHYDFAKLDLTKILSEYIISQQKVLSEKVKYEKMIERNYKIIRNLFKMIMVDQESCENQGLQYQTIKTFFFSKVKIHESYFSFGANQSTSEKDLENLFRSMFPQEFVYDKKGQKQKFLHPIEIYSFSRTRFIEFIIRVNLLIRSKATEENNAQKQEQESFFDLLKFLSIGIKDRLDKLEKFRRYKLLKKDVLDLFQTNKSKLLKVIEIYSKRGNLYYRDLKDLFMKESKPHVLNSEELLMLYSNLCTKSVIKDDEQNPEGKAKIKKEFGLPELCEIIARVADDLSRDTPSESMFLTEKIVYLLDQIFRIFPPSQNDKSTQNSHDEENLLARIQDEVKQLQNMFKVVDYQSEKQFRNTHYSSQQFNEQTIKQIKEE